MTCEKSCEARAYQLVIRQQQQALLDASLDLVEAAKHLDFYISEAGFDDAGDAQLARDAAAKATSAAMSGVQPA